MDPIYPWLDPVEVRRMADRLMRPGREPVVGAADAGFDEGFVGFASDPAASPASPPPLPPVATAATAMPVVQEAPVQEVPFQAVPETQPVPEPQLGTAPEENQSARGSFLDRITRFRDWMHRNFSATGVFILDREGAVIFDESSHGRLHFLARSLALASRRPGASAGNVHVKIGAGATLEVIPVETAYGCLVLGAVVPDALDPPSVNAVIDALNQVAAPPEG
jgi:hypothetical protein